MVTYVRYISCEGAYDAFEGFSRRLVGSVFGQLCLLPNSSLEWSPGPKSGR